MLFDHLIYHNTVDNWLLAAAVVFGIYIALRFCKAFIQRRIGLLAKKTATDWDDLAISLTEQIHGLFLVALAVFSGSLILTLPENITNLLKKGIFTLLLFQIALIVSYCIKYFIERYRHRKIESDAAAVTTLSSVGIVLKGLLWLILLLVVLDNFGMNVSTFIAGLGITGIAVALAVQNILGDLFASFSIIFDKPFVIGDFIVVGDDMGTVEHIGLKTTRIRSLTGEQLIISNGDLLRSRVRNYKRMYERRVVFSINVPYRTAYEQLQTIPKLIRKIIEGENLVRFERAHFKEYGIYSLDFEIVYWIHSPDYNVYMDIQQAINLSIFKQFKDEGIQFAYPTQALLIGNDSSSTVVSPADRMDEDKRNEIG